MVNQKKSKCQLRLEARAYEQQQQQNASCLAPTDTAIGATNEQLAAQMHSRIARATEVRVSKQRQRKNNARERVLHAQRVAREQHAKRREEISSVRRASGEKVEVARQRRRANLEQTQQLCKRRVAHVKKKVQSVKEVQKTRSERALTLLEAQLVEAARRREEQTQRMVRRLSQRWQSVESVKDRVARAKFIQRWYRRHVDARKNAASLRAIQTHVERVVRCWQQIATKGFESSMMLLQDRELARSAQSVLRVLLPSAVGNQSPGKPDSSSNGSSPRTKGASFRVLLMAGMIAFHPSEIMESGQCDRLAYAAKVTYKDMLRIFVLLESGTARELKTCVARLEAHFAFYFDSFCQWKDRDAERLATEMLRSYHDIYKMKKRYLAKQTALEGDGVHQLVFQTEKQLNQLKSALAQVIGRDDTLARVDAVERSIEQDEHMSSSDSSASDDDEQQQQETEEPSPASTNHEAPQQQQLPDAQIESFLSDEKLVHELIVNPEFRIPQTEGQEDMSGGGAAAASLASRIRDTMVKAFWDQVVAANDVTTLVARTEELRVQFATVVHMRPELVEDVNIALQPGVLEALMQNAEDNFVEIKMRCERVVHAILSAEAPARNESTHAFLVAFENTFAELQSAARSPGQAVRVLVDFLAFALKKIEGIRIDLMNVHMGMLGAYLQLHGVEYEQKRLHEKLTAGVRFEMTEKWLAVEMRSYWPTLSSEEKDNMARYDSAAFSKFLRHSMIALIGTHIEGASGVWPETFRYDVDRIRGYRDAVDRITVISSLLIVLQEYVTRRRLVAPRDFYRRVGQQLTDLLLSPGISGSHLVDQAVQEMRLLEEKKTHNPGVEDELKALEQRLHGAFGTSNPVFSLYSARAYSTILNAQFNEPSEIQVHASLVPFESEICALALAVRKLAKHNESVHAALYNNIIKQLIAVM
ncbi:hypothetical protein Gpo141_00011992 [Globisporangium polare]